MTEFARAALASICGSANNNVAAIRMAQRSVSARWNSAWVNCSVFCGIMLILAILALMMHIHPRHHHHRHKSNATATGDHGPSAGALIGVLVVAVLGATVVAFAVVRVCLARESRSATEMAAIAEI